MKQELIAEIKKFLFKRLQKAYEWGRKDEREGYEHEDWLWLEEDAGLMTEAIVERIEEER